MGKAKFECKIIGGWHTNVVTLKDSIILYYSGDGGAIVSAKTFEEASAKYIEAMEANRCLKMLLASMNDNERESIEEKLTDERIHNKIERRQSDNK